MKGEKKKTFQDGWKKNAYQGGFGSFFIHFIFFFAFFSFFNGKC